jgi:Na+/melibiose symporter-like transporter
MGIKSVKFRGRHNSWRAVLFLVTGSIAIVLFVVLSILSAVKGETSFSYGVAGIAAALISLVGLIVSIAATRERDVFMSVPIAGMIVNGISFLLYVIIYVLGLV